MKSLVARLLICAVPMLTATLATPAIAARGETFAAFSKRYIESIARLDPISGTQLGDHRFDDRLTDLSTAGRNARTREDRAMLATLGAIDRRTLTAERSGRRRPARE